MCGLGKLNAAALDTTVACGYNGTDQHNIGLLPPIAGIDTPISWASFSVVSIAPIAGIDISALLFRKLTFPIAPHRGVYKVL